MPRKHNPADRNVAEVAKLIIWWQEWAAANMPANKSMFSVLIDRTDSGPSNFDQEVVQILATLSQSKLFRNFV